MMRNPFEPIKKRGAARKRSRSYGYLDATGRKRSDAEHRRLQKRDAGTGMTRAQRDALTLGHVFLVEHKGSNRAQRRADRWSAKAPMRPGTNDSLVLDVDLQSLRHTGTYTKVAFGMGERAGARPSRRLVRTATFRSANAGRAYRRATR